MGYLSGEMMKAKILIVALGAALIAVLAYQIESAKGIVEARPEDSPAGSYRVPEPTYSRLVKAAQAGDCEAAYRLGRHHVFYSLNTQEAIRWYRLAAKCPHANAKGELIAILMHFDTDDREVDRLLSEIEQLDPKAAEGDRAAVMSVRALRGRHSK